MTAARDEDVGWLNVAVDDAFSMRRIECVGQLDGEGQNQTRFPSVAQPMRCLSVIALEKLHGDERFAVLVVNLVDGADIGMIEGGRSAGLAAERF